jgi:hypothetical protein
MSKTHDNGDGDGDGSVYDDVISGVMVMVVVPKLLMIMGW